MLPCSARPVVPESRSRVGGALISDLRGCSGQTKSNTPTKIGRRGDETVDRERVRAQTPVFTGHRAAKLARKRTQTSLTDPRSVTCPPSVVQPEETFARRLY